jgi:hypothetical protein
MNPTVVNILFPRDGKSQYDSDGDRILFYHLQAQVLGAVNDIGACGQNDTLRTERRRQACLLANFIGNGFQAVARRNIIAGMPGAQYIANLYRLLRDTASDHGELEAEFGRDMSERLVRLEQAFEKINQRMAG